MVGVNAIFALVEIDIYYTLNFSFEKLTKVNNRNSIGDKFILTIELFSSNGSAKSRKNK